MRARDLLAVLVVLATTVACVRLGFWQLARMRYKHALHAAQRALLAEAPIEVSGAIPTRGPEAGRRVHLRGRWDDSAQILLSGRTHLGAAGVSWVCAMRLDAGDGVLVERGWLAAEDSRTAHPELAPESNPDVIGVALPLERSPHPIRWAELTSQRPRTRLWSARALEADSARARFAPPVADWYVRVLPEVAHGPVHPGLAEPEDYVIPDESMHLSYAIQWFGFAVIIAAGSLALARRRKPVAGPRPG